ncbi:MULTISPECIES: acetyl-CoA carboxylase biotin carboxyl carrier protein [Paraburkholderia]|jgi:acetyl-CoA carboxylase biotin carboxyl carrier protein|uniref:Biotin carboxyl carrier protein of acetyl-CoA carboxylase n=1 Tax=Paraburkholderia phenazinium TaxID=60549 RepID=A0A1N6J9W7_9BURK|nr:acetyl-CoA carboxylase biotin carboxyl carrier protein [Paraburkholderia phenazinium]SIO41067.1 biotin carboxyl carrier protein [Paraburkholderia phenazinium]
MDLQKIKGLIDLLAESRLAELELIEGDEKIRLVKTHRRATSDASEDIPRSARSTPAEEAGQAVPPVAASTTVDATASEPQLVCAPMFGIVHLTPAPGEPPFVGVGDAVEEGQALCTIEAMKMFNAIESEFKGNVVEILVRPGDEVEAGQPLFRIR